MKKYLISISTALIFFSLSCESDFLNKNPLDQVSSEIFWTDEADIKMALAGCYNRFRSGFNNYRRPYLDCISDNATVRGDNYHGMITVQLGDIYPSFSPGRGGFLQLLYNSPYTAIASFNFFLENVDQVNSVDENKLNMYKGEVRFLRAMKYFDLVQSFGGVIIYDELPTVDNMFLAKSSKEQVLDFIHDDLDFAIANLPNETYKGHAVRASAQALKAKVHLYEQKWGEAAELCTQLMNSGLFRISDNYKLLFLSEGQEDNPEIIFSVKYSSPNDPQDSIEGMDVEFGMYNGINPYQDLVDEYEMIDGLSISESPLYNPDNPYVNRDPRLDMTIKLPDEIWLTPEGEPYSGNVSITDFQMEKYVNLDHAPFSYGKAYLTDQDYVHIRYADVLLMYAEAMNEDSGPGNSIYSAIDEIRTRPGVDMPPVNRDIYNTKDLLRDFIRHERRIELALEGQRFFDLKRWNIAHVKLPSMVNAAGIPMKFEQFNYLFPFPQYELDRNPNLEQNDGY